MEIKQLKEKFEKEGTSVEFEKENIIFKIYEIKWLNNDLKGKSHKLIINQQVFKENPSVWIGKIESLNRKFSREFVKSIKEGNLK